MFVKRDLAGLISAKLGQVPIVAIIGPRQSGKSTLIRKLFPNHMYVDMQDREYIIR